MIWPADPSNTLSNSEGLKNQELLGTEWRQDARGLQQAMSHLHQSGWYWGPVTAAEASQVLSNTPEGTFLLRDSYYKDYVLTLSMKTNLGPIHLRIEYCNGQFGFDTVMKTHLQEFGGAVDLVQHYALNYRHSSKCKQEPITGRDSPGSSTAVSEHCLQMKLTRPLYKVSPSLQHLCRMTINRHFCNHYNLPLPERLKDFLMEYPFVL
ncbi:suppressor of cytokine signaling 2-like [Lampris incognitus]|uniref:suppressor of cytokine signaling 2-like n=1 Tax=Lampris incognitus TaxID=2546036 RepID=UPI0024B5EC21|nr:suppressor of cytokine signaling 2-like [Lampris incognitus]